MAPVGLPCGHAYCAACSLVELREKGVPQTCLQCQPLGVGADGMFDLGFRVYTRIRVWITRAKHSWSSLSAKEQGEMDGVVNMLTAAAEQVMGERASAGASA